MAARTGAGGWWGVLWRSPALVDGLLGYAVAMAVGVAVFTSSTDSLAGSWPAYLFALGFGVLLLFRRRHSVLVLVLTSLGICVYYTLQYPPIGLALPIAAALFSVAEAGRLRIGIIISAVLVALSLYFQIVGGQDPRQLLGYELPRVIALMGASLALGMACDEDLARGAAGLANVGKRPPSLECERESTSGRVARQGNVGGIDSLLEQRLHP